MPFVVGHNVNTGFNGIGIFLRFSKLMFCDDAPSIANSIAIVANLTARCACFQRVFHGNKLSKFKLN